MRSRIPWQLLAHLKKLFENFLWNNFTPNKMYLITQSTVDLLHEMRTDQFL